jgi:hypothetical protein
MKILNTLKNTLKEILRSERGSFTFSITLISGQGVLVAENIPIQLSGAPVLLSGGVGWISVDQYGNLKLASGAMVIGQSGLNVILQSGAPVSLQSGTGVLVQTQSGGFVTLGSGAAVVASGLAVILQSGLAVTVPTTVSGNVFVINTSGTQFPSSPGIHHLVKLLNSSVVFVAGDISVNSGTGYVLAGNPMTDVGAQMKVTVNNLNKLYGIAQTSSLATFLTFNF